MMQKFFNLDLGLKKSDRVSIDIMLRGRYGKEKANSIKFRPIQGEA